MPRLSSLAAAICLAALAACQQPAPPPPAPPRSPAPARLPAPLPLPPVPVASAGDAGTDAGVPAALGSTDGVRAALAAHGVQVMKSEALAPLGREGCHDEHRERLLLSKGYLDVTRFSSPAAADACLGAMRRQLAKAWPKIGSAFVVRGRFMGEVAESLPPAERQRIRAALMSSL